MAQVLYYPRESASQSAGPCIHVGLASGAAGLDIYWQELGRDLAGPNADEERSRVEDLVTDGLGARQ